MIIGMTLEWPLNTLKRELGAGRWQEDVACFHLSLGVRISGWVVFCRQGWARKPAQLRWGGAGHPWNCKYARDPRCDADRHPPCKAQTGGTHQVQILNEIHLRPIRELSSCRWNGKGRGADGREIFVAEPTWLSSVRDTGILFHVKERQSKCRPLTPGLRIREVWFVPGDHSSSLPLIYQLMWRKAFMCDSCIMDNLVHPIMKKQ